MCTFFCVSLLAFDASAQENRRVSGLVQDADGIALPGVNVVEAGTLNGTTTNLDGRLY